jgi:hypothetical protein
MVADSRTMCIAALLPNDDGSIGMSIVDSAMTSAVYRDARMSSTEMRGMW